MSTLSEKERLIYLDLLGIDQWLPLVTQEQIEDKPLDDAIGSEGVKSFDESASNRVLIDGFHSIEPSVDAVSNDLPTESSNNVDKSIRPKIDVGQAVSVETLNNKGQFDAIQQEPSDPLPLSEPDVPPRDLSMAVESPSAQNETASYINAEPLAAMWRVPSSQLVATVLDRPVRVLRGGGLTTNPNGRHLILSETNPFEIDLSYAFSGESFDLLQKMLIALKTSTDSMSLASLQLYQNSDAPTLRDVLKMHQFQSVLLMVPLPSTVGPRALKSARQEIVQLADTAVPLAVTFHPHYLIRYPKVKSFAWHDIQRWWQCVNNLS